MRVLLLPDAAFLHRERAMLSRLEVGLADEGVRVYRGMPESAGSVQPPQVCSTPVGYGDAGLPLTRWLRVDQLASALRAQAPPGQEGPPVHLVHCFGPAAWGFGMELADRLGRGCRAVLEVFDGAMLASAVSWARRLPVGVGGTGLGLAHSRPVCVGCDEPIAQQLARTLRPSEVGLARWGTHIPEEPLADADRRDDPARAPTAVLIASGRDPRAVRTALEGVAEARRRVGELLVFVDSTLADAVPIWQWARALGIGPALSVIADLEGRRELAVQASLLILPEALGEHRSLTLDAMAAGMPVVARRDPLVGWLRPETARIVEVDPAPGGFRAWTDAIAGLLTDQASAAALGARARQAVAAERLVSGHVRELLGVYEATVRTLPAAALRNAAR